MARMRFMPVAACVLLCMVAFIFSCGCGETLDEVVGSAEEVACGGLSGSDRDHCYQDAAVRKSDPSLCEEIEYGPPRSKCYLRIAEKEGDSALCGKLMIYPGSSGEYSRLECYQRVAVTKKDPAYCDMMGTHSAGMLSGEYNREGCYRAIGIEFPTILNIYEENEERFQFCYDIVYSEIHGAPPPQRSENPDVAAERAMIAREIEDAGYREAGRGYVAEENPEVSYMDLEEGDIILFGFDKSPGTEDAPHYAVVQGGRIWQIVNWGKSGGVLDGPHDPEYFFKPRQLTNPDTGETTTSPRIYHYYAVYRRS
ncbi:MAG: hypothetical protein RQ758_08110 [Methanomicrobiaceae archaeon]|nr:hypothetical protein [Methanomicrobiaceae archaeon]